MFKLLLLRSYITCGEEGKQAVVAAALCAAPLVVFPLPFMCSLTSNTRLAPCLLVFIFASFTDLGAAFQMSEARALPPGWHSSPDIIFPCYIVLDRLIKLHRRASSGSDLESIRLDLTT